MTSLLSLHKIAAQRGDGLRPELVRLLEQSGASAAAYRPSAVFAQCEAEQVHRPDEMCERAEDAAAIGATPAKLEE